MYAHEWFFTPGLVILGHFATLLAIKHRTWMSKKAQLDLHMADLEENIHTWTHEKFVYLLGSLRSKLSTFRAEYLPTWPLTLLFVMLYDENGIGNFWIFLRMSHMGLC